MLLNKTYILMIVLDVILEIMARIKLFFPKLLSLHIIFRFLKVDLKFFKFVKVDSLNFENSQASGVAVFLALVIMSVSGCAEGAARPATVPTLDKGEANF